MSVSGNSRVVPIREREILVLPIIDATPPEMYRRLETDLRKALKR
jgi:hypothetical protein